MYKTKKSPLLQSQNGTEKKPLDKRRFGDRLRFAREFLGISRMEIERSVGIDEATLRKFEKSNTGFAGIEFLRKIFNRYEKFRTYVDPMWLIHGIGAPPDFFKTVEERRELPFSNHLFENLALDKENAIVEIMLWRSLYSNADYTKISEDFEMPQVKKGDFIGFILIPKENIDSLPSTEVFLATEQNPVGSVFLFLGKNSDEKYSFVQKRQAEKDFISASLAMEEIQKIGRIVMHRKVIESKKKIS